MSSLLTQPGRLRQSFPSCLPCCDRHLWVCLESLVRPDSFHPQQGGCSMIWWDWHREPPLLLSAGETAEREREWGLPDSSSTRIPAGRTPPRDCDSRVAGKHQGLKWCLPLLSLSAGRRYFLGSVLGLGKIFFSQVLLFQRFQISQNWRKQFILFIFLFWFGQLLPSCSKHNLTMLDSCCSAQSFHKDYIAPGSTLPTAACTSSCYLFQFFMPQRWCCLFFY